MTHDQVVVVWSSYRFSLLPPLPQTIFTTLYKRCFHDLTTIFCNSEGQISFKTACSHFSIRHKKQNYKTNLWPNSVTLCSGRLEAVILKGCLGTVFFLVNLRSFTFFLCHLCSWLILFTDLRSLHLPTADILFNQQSNTWEDVELGTQINSRIQKKTKKTRVGPHPGFAVYYFSLCNRLVLCVRRRKEKEKNPNKGHLVCFWLHKIAIGYLQSLLPQECGARSNIFVNKVLLRILTYKFIKNMYFFRGMKTICLQLLFYHLLLLYQLTPELNLKHKPDTFYYSESKGVKWPRDNIQPPYHYCLKIHN